MTNCRSWGLGLEVNVFKSKVIRFSSKMRQAIWNVSLNGENLSISDTYECMWQ